MKIAVAGASGFIGKILCEALSPNHVVYALTRRSLPIGPATEELGPGKYWRSCNLFSLLEVEQALAGAELGIYLVHSMVAPSRLTQGGFADLDLILADNFARAAKLHKLRRIIYLGGLIPAGHLSSHLASRREVEKVLGSTGIPVVTLRAGLIIGANGSSYQIMARLVRRLPTMICPPWTRRRCQPIAESDAITLLKDVAEDESLPPGAYDIGGPSQITYVDMMRQTALALHVKRRFINAPYVSPKISRLWVSLVTNSSRELVYPLVESLKHDMVARDDMLVKRYGMKPLTFAEALQRAESQDQPPAIAPEISLPVAALGHRQVRKVSRAVSSVQRMPLPSGWTVDRVAKEYAAWLPRALRPFIAVTEDEVGRLDFRIMPLGRYARSFAMLILTPSVERSSSTRRLFYITGGLLLRRVPGKPRGRFEFRKVPDAAEVMAAVLDFQPSLPWWIYKWTQALAHLTVMRLFRRHLGRLSRLPPAAVDAYAAAAKMP